MAVDSIKNTRRINEAINRQSEALAGLASGKRINRARDDAAGLAIADALAADVRVREVAERNVADAQSLIQIRDGAAEQIGNIAARQKELAIQASNGTLSDTQRTALNQEFQALNQEAQRIAATTEFNGRSAFEGTSVQVGDDASSNSQIAVASADINTAISGLSSQSIATQAGAQAALGSVDSFINAVAQTRGEGGAAAARIEFAGNNIAVEKENAAAAESRIRDADIAELVRRVFLIESTAMGTTSLSNGAHSKRRKYASRTFPFVSPRAEIMGHPQAIPTEEISV